MAGKGGGGAWKVAYADFVTAMMALFMVLWLAAQDQKIKEAVERAFRHPFMSLTKESAGLMPNVNKNSGSSQSGKFETATATAVELAMLRRLQQDISTELAKRVEESDDTLKFQLTPEGLRITLLDRGQKPVFQPDSHALTDYGSWVLSTVAWQVSRYTNFAIEVEGHTEKGRAPLTEEYGSWELSADRATASRRKLIEDGVVDGQVVKVAGFGHTLTLPGIPPESDLNRRITLMLRVQPMTHQPPGS